MDVKSMLASRLGELGRIIELCTVSYSLVNGRLRIYYVKVPVKRVRRRLRALDLEEAVFEVADRLGFKYVVSKVTGGGRKYYLIKDLKTYKLLANRNVRLRRGPGGKPHS